ncbi:MAG: cytochrome-c peroxidase [Bdellovibrionales bacterium]|nr:cytochrome-c peroxidase [Bdellovibrionales bacterium]
MKFAFLFCGWIAVVAVGMKARGAELYDSEPLMPIPEITLEGDQDKVLLGALLFYDKRLSKDNTVSCTTCHDLNKGGADGKIHSHGVSGSEGEINAPTVFNSTFNFRQFWDGRAKTLEEQIDGPLQNPKEMGSIWSDVVLKLKADPKIQQLFKQLYKEGVTAANIKNAIATFERTLITPHARFDKFLKGDTKALSDFEKLGYQRFKIYGCVACHQGVNVGGNMFQNMGVMGNYFKDRGTPLTNSDFGRFRVTREEQDRFVFRVPTLRNIELTPPYFHDGSAKTLEDAVTVMTKYQLGRKISKEERDSIVAFLKTLTGQPPKSLKLLKRVERP